MIPGQRPRQRILATRTGSITQETDGPAIAVTGAVLGDIVIGDSVYTIEDAPAAPAPFDGDPLETPSRLLAVHQQTITFTGRTRELAALDAWRDDAGSNRSIRLIHGPGGQGKTRLALRFTALSIAAGWRVVQARHSATLASARADPQPTGSGDQGLVLIVDYAERWPTEHLLGVLAAPILRRQTRVRVLLISRQAGDWWQSIRHELHKFAPGIDQTRLETLAPGQDDRVGVFLAARDEFARILDVDASDIPPPADLSGDAFDLVLSIHMAALVAVHRRTRGAASSSDVAGLSTYLLERERAAWHALGRRGLISTSPAVMAKAVTTAILTRALPAAGAVEVLAKAGVVDAAGAAPVLDDHAVCYPSTRMNSFLEPLYPDRLAEDFLALMLPGHQSPDFFVPASVALWADTLVDTLLTPADDDTAEPWLRESLVVLIETAQRWPHVAQKHLFPLLRKRPRLAIVAGGAAIIRLVEMPDADLETLGAIESQLPRRRHVDLDSASAAVSERIVALVMARTQDRVVWANLLTTLGRRLAYAGHQERALAVFGRAVRICAKLDGTDPDGIHAPEAAYAHDMCGLMLLELGRAAQAVEPSRNAVARYRTLVRRDRGHLPRLAGALSNLGLVLAHNDQIHDAIATGREALRIRRRLYRRDPESYAEELAISLSNLGGDLARLNRNTEALAMTQESLELRRRLAAQAPQTFSVEVAISLNNLVSIYLALHRTDEALRAASEAVEIRRGLASVNEAAFERPLASALQNLGALQVSLGQFDEAVTTFTHIVEIHRRLARADPVADADRQAGATAQLAALMLRAGRGEEARDLAAEALSLERHMTQVTPTKTRSHLVVASTYLVRALCAIGDRAEAETLARGVLDRGTSWAAAGEPAGHRVAQAFDLLRRALNRADFHDESLAAAEICVRMYRASDIRTDDDANILGFADALVGLGLCLRGAGRHPEGLRVVRDALAMIQRRGPEAIGALQVVAVAATVADSLLSYETGDFPRAVQASVEAVEASRGVVLPAQNAKLLVNVLELIAAWLRATDREAEATQARDRVDEVRARETVEDVDEIRLVRW